MGTLRNKRQIERLESDENVVLTESKSIQVILKKEIDFGYDHVILPGIQIKSLKISFSFRLYK